MENEGSAGLCILFREWLAGARENLGQGLTQEAGVAAGGPRNG